MILQLNDYHHVGKGKRGKHYYQFKFVIGELCYGDGKSYASEATAQRAIDRFMKKLWKNREHTVFAVKARQ